MNSCPESWTIQAPGHSATSSAGSITRLPASVVHVSTLADERVQRVVRARVVDEGYPAHTHDAWTLIRVDAGRLNFRAAHDDLTVGAGEVALIPPGVAHGSRPGPLLSPYIKTSVHLAPDVLGPRARTGSARSVKHSRLAKHLDEMLEASAVADIQLEQEAIDRLLVQLGAVASGQSAPRPPAESDRADLAASVRAALLAGFTQQVGLQELAADLRCSSTRVLRQFKRAYGMTPYAYLIGLRVDAACTMLLAGARPDEIATEVGFYDQAHLTRHFRRITHTTPGRWAKAPRHAHGAYCEELTDPRKHGARGSGSDLFGRRSDTRATPRHR